MKTKENKTCHTEQDTTKKVSKDVGLVSRTSIYLSRPKKKETEQPKAPRKHRLPANSNGNLTK